MSPRQLVVTALLLAPFTANAALWKTRSPEERQAAQVRKVAYRAARAEFRGVVRGSSALRLRHARSIAGAAGFGVGLGFITGGTVAYTAAIPDMMLKFTGHAPLMGERGARITLALSALTALASAPMYYREGVISARTKTVGLGVERGLISRDRASAWEQAGLVYSSWRERWAFDGLPIYEPEK